MALPKRYVAVARLGALSTTGDPEGEITATGLCRPTPSSCPPGASPSARRPTARCGSAAGAPTSAPAAREEVSVPEREVTVDRFEELHRDGDRAGFAIECSSGTYVRA